MSFWGVERKKGLDEKLDGRLTVYARVSIEPDEMASLSHPVASLTHNGLLVAQGNYREQNNLRDFLKSEMGLSFEEGLEQLLERLDGLESALDPDKLREKMEHFDEMEDFIPTPAKIVPFHSEEEILAQEGDVFFAGEYKKIGNAVLSVNSFPILYQARYREQVMDLVRQEIDNLIAQIETGPAGPDRRYDQPGVDPEGEILKQYIPNMLYCRKDEKVFGTARRQFEQFMAGYTVTNDIEAIVAIIHDTPELSKRHYTLLELYARKIALMKNEDFGGVEEVQEQITHLRSDRPS